MGTGGSIELTYHEGFGNTKEDALQSLSSSLKYKYGSSLIKMIYDGEYRHGYMYGGALLEVKYSVSHNIVRAFVDLI
jgi:hypothetical protein